MTITELRQRIANHGTDGVAADVAASNVARHGQEQAPLTDAEQGTADYWREVAR